jgi:hypothetical protein
VNVAIQRQIANLENTMQRKDSMDTPLSQSNVSLRLSLIRKECEKLLEEGETTLTLVDPDDQDQASGDSCNPYDRGE